MGVFLFILTELIFWVFDSKKPSKENKIAFTVKRKGIAALWSAGILSQVVGGVQTYKEVSPLVVQQFPEILKWVGYIGEGIFIVALVVLVLYVYLILNSMKYDRSRRRVRRRAGRR